MKFHIFRFPKPAKVLAVCASSTKYLCLAAPLTLPINSSAGIEKNMADMFNSMGAEANYTEAGAFHGQSGNLYTGGSLTTRNPVSDVSLANIQLPSISAGCGGIDFFAGSFSFVNKEQFIQFTRNLGNNAAGVAFDLALKALDPMIQDAIGGIRDLVNYVNQNSLNSCKLSQDIVGGAMGKRGSLSSSNCRAASVDSGSSNDPAEGTWYCQAARNLVHEADKVRNTGKPQDTISYTGGNLTYEAMKNYTGQRSKLGIDMDFYYSMLGTVVFTPLTQQEGDKDKYTVGIQSFEPKILSIQDLLNGKNNAGGEIREKIVLDMWTCKDGSKKLKENCIEKNDVEIPSLRYMVHKRIETLPTAIRNNQGWNLSSRKQIAAIVNNSKLPILKMAVSDAFLGTGYLKKTAVLDAIAVDIMANILDQSERQVRSTLGMYNKTDDASGEAVRKLFANLGELRSRIYQERIDSMKKIEIEESMMRAMEQFETQWRSAFVDTNNSMTFDSMNRF